MAQVDGATVITGGMETEHWQPAILSTWLHAWSRLGAALGAAFHSVPWNKAHVDTSSTFIGNWDKLCWSSGKIIVTGRWELNKLQLCTQSKPCQRTAGICKWQYCISIASMSTAVNRKLVSPPNLDFKKPHYSDLPLIKSPPSEMECSWSVLCAYQTLLTMSTASAIQK